MSLLMLFSMMPVTVIADTAISGACTDLFAMDVPGGVNVTIANDANYPWAKASDGIYHSYTESGASTFKSTLTLNITAEENCALLFDYAVSCAESDVELEVEKNGEPVSLPYSFGNADWTSADDIQWTPMQIDLSAGETTLTFCYHKARRQNPAGLGEAYLKNLRIPGEVQATPVTVHYDDACGVVEYNGRTVADGETLQITKGSVTLVSKAKEGFFVYSAGYSPEKADKYSGGIVSEWSCDFALVDDIYFNFEGLIAPVVDNQVSGASISFTNDDESPWMLDEEFTEATAKPTYYCTGVLTDGYAREATVLNATVTAPAGGLYLMYETTWSNYSDSIEAPCGNDRYIVLLDCVPDGSYAYPEKYMLKARAGHDVVTDKFDLPWYADCVYIPEGTHTVTWLYADAYYGGSPMSQKGLDSVWLRNFRLMPKSTDITGKLTVVFDEKLGTVSAQLAGDAEKEGSFSSAAVYVNHPNEMKLGDSLTEISSGKVFTGKLGQAVMLKAKVKSEDYVDFDGFYVNNKKIQQNTWDSGMALLTYPDEDLKVEVRFIEHSYAAVTGTDALDIIGISSIETRDNHPWTMSASDGVSVFASGNKEVTGGSVSPLKLTISETGTLTFQYKVSSEANYDYLAYSLNSEITSGNHTTTAANYQKRADFSGEKNWTNFSLEVQKGDSVYLGFYKDGGGNGGEDTAWIRNLQITAKQAQVSVTSGDTSCGTVTGDTSVTTMAIGSRPSYTATPSAGCTFYGWFRVENGEPVELLSTDSTYSFTVIEDVAVQALFAPNGTYVARNNKAVYETLSAALSAASSGDTVVLLKDVALDSDLTVPAGVTLLVPCMDNDPGLVNGRNPDGAADGKTTGVGTNAKLYSTLTIPEGKTLTVNGTLIVNAVTGRPLAGHYDQDITGGYAKIALDGDIVVNGTLKNYGYIEGAGSVTANDGGTVGDLYIATNWRGGTQASNMYSAKVYPMNEYAVKNISVPVTLKSGSLYTALVKMYASNNYYYTEFPQVGANALIQPAAGTGVTKTVENGREKYAINGSAVFGSSVLNIVGMNLGTDEFVYPWDGDMDFELNGGTVTFSNSFKFMPGATVTVKDGTAVAINSGKTVVFYDDTVFVDVANTDSTQYPHGRGNAKLIVGKNVTITNNGTLAGELDFSDGSSTVTGSSWTATTKEANGYNNGARSITHGATFNRTNYTADISTHTLVWKGNPVTVTFDVNGGSAMQPYTGEYNKAFTPEEATRVGYVFDGWFLADGTTQWVDGTALTANVTLTAHWHADVVSYTVKHHFEKLEAGYYDVETKTLQGTSDTDTAAAAQTAPGFSVQNFAQKNIAPDGSTVVDIFYTRNSYTLTWDLAGGALSSTGHTAGTVRFGTRIVKPANDPTRTGYGFSGWTGYTADMTMPAADTTMTADWTAEQYTVTFKANNGVTADTTKDVTYDGTYGELPAVTRTGYDFDGWYYGDTKIVSTDKVAVTNDVTFNAKWIAKTFTVTFDADGGSACDSITVTYDAAYGTLPKPTKTGYRFTGWYDGSTQVYDTTVFKGTEAPVLVAHWNVAAYDILYYIDGELLEDVEDTRDYGTALTGLYPYTKIGYTVSEWKQKDGSAVPATMPSKRLSLYAVTAPVDYTITYSGLDNAQNNAANPASYTIEDAKITVLAPSRTGYTFAGWVVNSSGAPVMTYEIPAGSTGNVALEAKWSVNTHSLKYYLDGAEKYSETVAYGADVTVKADETKTGYTFSGWTVTGAAASEGKFTMPDNDVTVSGTFTANTYTVKFDANGGTGTMADQEFTYDGARKLTKSTFTKEGYTFLGWENGTSIYTDEQIVSRLSAEDGDVITLKAKWGVNTYTITFDTDGGSLVNPIMDEYGTAVTAPADPIKAGYEFTGWDKNVPSAMPAENITIKATWDSYLAKIERMENFKGDNLTTARGYYVKLNTEQKASDSEKLAQLVDAIKADAVAEINAAISNAIAPTNETLIVDGEKIAEMALDGKTVNVKLVEEDYLAINMRSVNFLSELFGYGEIKEIKIGNQASVSNITQDALMLAVAAEAGIDLATAQTVTVSALDGKTMNVVLSAETPEFIPYSVEYTLEFFNNTHNVTWNADGGTLSGTYTNGSTAYGTAIVAPTAEKTGYTFGGWDNTTAVMGKTDLVYNASWTANTYAVKFDSDNGTACADTTATFDAAYGTLPAATREGYTFNGWYDGDTLVTANTVYKNAADTTLKAKWTLNSYKLTYKVDGAEVNSLNVNYGETIPAYTYTKTGYTVSAWENLPETMPADDVTATATSTVNSYTVKYLVDGSEVHSETVVYDTSIPSYTYTLTGYDVSAWANLPAKMPANDVTVTATKAAHKHSLVYKVDNVQKSSEDVSYGAVVTVKADETKTGYTFSGWTVTGAAASEGKFTMPDNDVTASGTFTANTYTVKFDANGGTGTMADQTFTYDAAQALAENTFTKTGYTFGGWVCGTDTYTDKQSVKNLSADANSELTLKAVWNINSYTITFNTDGGNAIAPITGEYGSAVTAPADPAKAGYLFKNWDVAVPDVIPAENITITAQWESYLDLLLDLPAYEDALAQARDYYALLNDDQNEEFWDSDRCEEFEDAVLAYSEDLLLKAVDDAVAPTNELLMTDDGAIATITKNGESVEIRLDSEDYLAAQMININFLAALFGYPEVRSVTVGDQDEVKITGNAGGDQMNIMLAVAAEAGISVAGASSVKVSALDGKSMTVELVAETVEGFEYGASYELEIYNNRHNVSWDAQGGELSGDYTNGLTAYGTAIVAPTVTKTGYTFGGWDNSTAVMGKTDLAFKASWTVNTYTVSFDAAGGSTCADKQVVFGTAYGELPETTRNGYTFNGWFDGANKITADTLYTKDSDVKLTAQWTENKYSITYTGEGISEGMNPAEYSVTSETFTLVNPTRFGYDFIGWTGSNSAIPALTMTVVMGTTGDLTFTANWKETEYAVDFSCESVYDGTESDMVMITETVRDYKARTLTFTVDDSNIDNKHTSIVVCSRDGAEDMILEPVEGVYTVTDIYSDISISVRTIIRGDINLDNVVDSRDLTIVAKCLAGKTTVDGYGLAAADCDADGDIDDSDLTIIAEVLAGIRNEW